MGAAMVMIIEAIYSEGLLRPVDALKLPEQQRVRLIIESVECPSESARAAALSRLKERINKTHFSYGGRLPSRDELHDRV